MRIVFVVIVSLSLLSCAHTPSAGGDSLPRCPESDKASMCSSGPLECKLDEKRSCDLCLCQHAVF